jgi:hypothetical protein
VSPENAVANEPRFPVSWTLKLMGIISVLSPSCNVMNLSGSPGFVTEIWPGFWSDIVAFGWMVIVFREKGLCSQATEDGEKVWKRKGE